ncbi:MAG: AAA family ATPase [Ignavibacteriales bacterium]|nr:AAA family ATPase [Ignavibacteriales bacterium]
MSPEEITSLLAEAFEHLWHGRFRLALIASQKVYDAKPDDYNAALCLAWSLLENGDPVKALELANLAVEQSGNAIQPRLYRGFFLSRMSIFEGALSDLNSALEQEQSLITWTYLNKARSLAGLGRFFEALEEIDKAISADPEKNANLNNLKKWYKIAGGFDKDLVNGKSNKPVNLLDEAEEALKQKEFWFTLLATRKILDNPKQKKEHKKALLLELEAMFLMYQYRPALEKANGLKEMFSGNNKFENIYNSLVKLELKETQEESISEKIINIEKRIDFVSIPNSFAFFTDTKVFSLPEIDETNRKYLIQFDEKKTSFVAAEIIFKNPFFKKKDQNVSPGIVWFLNNKEVGKNNFNLRIDKNWQLVTATQSWGTDFPGFWKRGQGKLELYIDNEKVLEKYFLVGDSEIIYTTEAENILIQEEKSNNTIIHQIEETKTESFQQPVDETLQALLINLNSFVGLDNVKQTVKNFISYLEFLKERKKSGLRSESGQSFHCVFQGNPGTGKTTIARMLGRILKAMGLLEKGHVIEVDRSGLVGQYIGETAIKTNKVIDESIGGVLFIDEAYTLSKKSGAQDFGQEAIETLLKRMEDKGNEFAVIVAGYPDEMTTFLESTPGLKSRFNHIFTFDDYNPDELLEIFKLVIKKEDYKIDELASDLVKKEFTKLYRRKDKTFSNARIAKMMFDKAKMHLSKRFLNTHPDKRTKENLTTILFEDIEAAILSEDKKDFAPPIDEENLSKALQKLNAMVGMENIKKEIDELVKIAKYYSQQGEDLRNKFSSHIVFLGNPGTGKTTVARIFSEIYSAIGILSKGHLVEADRQGLVASYVGQTAKQTTELINKAIGGTLFIDETYSLAKKDEGKGDFGQEAIDTLLKRMEDDRGKFLVIAAGYTDEMKSFLESNPGLQSRFNKTFFFEDYSPDELLKITENELAAKGLKLNEECFEPLKKYYNELYRNRDKTFGNARLVRNMTETVIRNQLLRIVAEAGTENQTAESTEIIIKDIEDIISFKKEKKFVKVEGDSKLLDLHLIELQELTGLETVKKSVEKLINSLKVTQLRQQRGLSIIEKNLHSVFTGNPGTGKTTVARLLSKIYKEMGLLEKGHLVEVKRSDLVAGYQGQTAIKTEKIIKQALGGTLFIDEAYTLSRGSSDFGQEAIDTLIKEMEDNRDKFLVIVAGYPDEMNIFLNSNPGLQSRFSNYFKFEDYTSRQLLEIAAAIALNNGYRLDEGALQFLLEIFSNLYLKRNKTFGNARTARNILYEAISNQEERISQIYDCSDEDLTTILLEDVEKITKFE